MSLVDMTKYTGISIQSIADPTLPPSMIKLVNSDGTVSTLTNSPPQASPLLTAKEVMTYLRISRSTLYRLLDRGELVSHKVGSAHRFFRDDVQAYVKGK